MSVCYYVIVEIYAPFNESTLSKIIKKASYSGMKLAFNGEDKQLFDNDIIPFILQKAKQNNFGYVNIWFKEDIVEGLSFRYKNKNIMQLVLSLQKSAWEKKFLYPPKTKDTITPTSILLDLVSDFSIQNCFIDFDYREEFKFSDQLGIFYALGLNTGSPKKCVTRDALHIIKSLEKIECAFLTDDCQPMNSVEVLSKIKSMLCMSVNDTDSIIIKTSAGYLVKAYFWGRHIKFWPLEPWCIKTTEYHTGIDVAHYIQILLAAMEPFNIYELATHCNDAFYEEDNISI